MAAWDLVFPGISRCPGVSVTQYLSISVSQYLSISVSRYLGISVIRCLGVPDVLVVTGAGTCLSAPVAFVAGSSQWSALAGLITPPDSAESASCLPAEFPPSWRKGRFSGPAFAPLRSPPQGNLRDRHAPAPFLALRVFLCIGANTIVPQKSTDSGLWA